MISKYLKLISVSVYNTDNDNLSLLPFLHCTRFSASLKDSEMILVCNAEFDLAGDQPGPFLPRTCSSRRTYVKSICP